jgi:hypothetical protein
MQQYRGNCVFYVLCAKQQYELGSLWQVARLRDGSYNRTVFSVWSVPRLYNEIPKITEAVESELELAEQSSAAS